MALEDSQAYQSYMQSKATAQEVKQYSDYYCQVTVKELLERLLDGMDSAWELIKTAALTAYHMLLNIQQCVHKQVIDPDKVNELYEKMMKKVHDMLNNNKGYNRVNEALNSSLDKFKAGEDGCDDISKAYEELKKMLHAIQSFIDDVLNKLESLFETISQVLQEIASVINCIAGSVINSDTLNTLSMIDPGKASLISKVMKYKDAASNKADAFYQASQEVDQYTGATVQMQDMIDTMTTLEI
ncbi:MAG: hypothetical protein GXO10_02915 [Crenarchaeota archaeon]|nr:hypothetical protein [Thermoproteota archaeon]